MSFSWFLLGLAAGYLLAEFRRAFDPRDPWGLGHEAGWRDRGI